MTPARSWSGTGTGPRCYARGAGGSFDDLASLDDLDRMVSSLGLRESSLRMVQDGETLPPSAYTSTPSAEVRAKDGAVNAALVYERYEQGATIVLEGLHRYWEPLTDFCRELEVALGHRLQVNAYITPPGSQGFDVHRDEHDVFVLQLWGNKHWIVYDRDDEERVLIDESIEPGASLYIPQGFPHAATTGTAGSAHLTVGILTHDSSAVLTEIVKLASEEPAFQDRLESVERRRVEDGRGTTHRGPSHVVGQGGHGRAHEPGGPAGPHHLAADPARAVETARHDLRDR